MDYVETTAPATGQTTFQKAAEKVRLAGYSYEENRIRAIVAGLVLSWE